MTKTKKLLLIFGSSFGVLLLVIGGYAYYLYDSVKDTVSEMHEPIQREVPSREIDIDRKQPISFLITGVDARADNHSGRSDTIIVMTVNPNKQSIQMLSIPRDTRTEIVGRGFDDKINHAYAFGGVQMTMATVEKFLDIPIDHYVSINMEGFKNIVDALGGVVVQNSFPFQYDGHQFNEGEIFLNGTQALAYSRMRYEDPRGDFGRNDRQRQIVDAVIQEGAQLSSVTKIRDILGALGGSVRTDLDFDAMVKYQSKYRDARHKIDQLQISGDGTKINGIYYYIVSDEEKNRVSSILREHLELD